MPADRVSGGFGVITLCSVIAFSIVLETAREVCAGEYDGHLKHGKIVKTLAPETPHDPPPLTPLTLAPTAPVAPEKTPAPVPAKGVDPLPPTPTPPPPSPDGQGGRRLLAVAGGDECTSWASAMDGWDDLMLTCGVVSTIAGLIFFALERYRPELAEKLTMPFTIFFFVVWTAGALFGTFWGPFEKTTNLGYFAVWCACATSFHTVYVSFKQFRTAVHTLSHSAKEASNEALMMFIIVVCSGVELLAASIDCHKGEDSCAGRAAWAMAVGVISLAVSISLLLWLHFRSLSQKPMQIVGAGFTLWWLVALFSLTFARSSPFYNTGNGFFAIILATLCSICLFMDAMGHHGNVLQLQRRFTQHLVDNLPRQDEDLEDGTVTGAAAAAAPVPPPSYDRASFAVAAADAKRVQGPDESGGPPAASLPSMQEGEFEEVPLPDQSEEKPYDPKYGISPEA